MGDLVGTLPALGMMVTGSGPQMAQELWSTDCEEWGWGECHTV